MPLRMPSDLEAGTTPRAPDRPAAWLRLGSRLLRWVDTGGAGSDPGTDEDHIDWLRAVPFIAMHLACLAAIWVGISPVAIAVAIALYAIRMFALTGFYHRYFAHRTFRTSRPMQFAFALIGASCAQRGPLWWAAQHRHHHRHADTPLDWHSPRHRSLAHSHMGWFLTPSGFRTDRRRIPDLIRFPELCWLDRFDTLVPICLALLLFGAGALLESVAPHLGTSGWQLLVWGFCISTVALFHASVTINSLSHRFGSRRFETPDDSRNNAWLALLTLGEGWHNNHHFCPGSARHGFRWWELDLTYCGLWLLAALGLVHDLKPVPAWAVPGGESSATGRA